MAVHNINPVIEQQAKLMAADAREAAPDIERIIWFPDDAEVRLVEITPLVPAYRDSELYPFYFPASPDHELPAKSAVMMIRPDEVARFNPPTGWGEWSDGIEL